MSSVHTMLCRARYPGGKTMALPAVMEVDPVGGIYRVQGKSWPGKPCFPHRMTDGRCDPLSPSATCPVGPRYAIQAHIGSGAYGDVVRALDRDTGETVALKVRGGGLGRWVG